MTLFDALVAVGKWGQQHPQILWGTMGGGFHLGMVLRAVTGGHRRRRDIHGSARWATYREVKSSGLSRRQGRQELSSLDDDQLKDVGISREDAVREASKPFWRP